MDTLAVIPAELDRIAARLHALARAPLITAAEVAEVRSCRDALARVWSGGTAAPAARSVLDTLAAAAELLVSADQDGLPAWARDRINRERLAHHPALDWLADYLAHPDTYLLGFDPAGDGRLIVAFGDPDTSASVATYVPGAGASLSGCAGELERALALHSAAGRDSAVIMWLGYDPPDGVDAARDTAARNGAADLAAFQDGLVASHHGPIKQQTVLGHSYGSLLIGLAERSHKLAADDLVLLGSPGVGASHAAQLRDPAQVWAATAANDPVRLAPSPGEAALRLLGGPVGLLAGTLSDLVRGDADLWHGTDPTHPSFGGQVFESSADGHSGYFREDNPALATMAGIVTRGE